MQNKNNGIFFSLVEFASFCESGTNSGKAKSYANAIQYLCDYLKIDITYLSANDIQLIKHEEYYICSKNSESYNRFLKFLTSRGRSSYLKNGFVKAALPYFYQYCSLHNIL